MPLSKVEFTVEQPTSTYTRVIIVSSQQACTSLFILLFNSETATMQNLHTLITTCITWERTVLKELITLYCVRYDPFYCKSDPERIWLVVERSGGHVYAGPVGILDFYVPEKIITQVILMDSGLSVRMNDSYI
jgi:hypothetical protein